MSSKSMGNMMQQAQQMQQKMEKLQEELAQQQVEATAGGGMVKVVANGKQQVESLQIDPQVVDPDDVAMLQDMVAAAVNEALKQSQDLVQGEMSKLTGGMQIPGLF